MVHPRHSSHGTTAIRHADLVTALPMFPLGAVLLPGAELPLRVFEERYRTMVEHCLADDGRFGVVLIARGSEVGGGEERTEIGTVAQIDRYVRAPGGRFTLLCTGTERIVVNRWLPDDPYPLADVDVWTDDQQPADPTTLLHKRVELEKAVAQLAQRQGHRHRRWPALDLPGNPTDMSFALAQSLPLTDADRQSALQAAGPRDRLQILESAVDDVIAGVRFRLQT